VNESELRPLQSPRSLARVRLAPRPALDPAAPLAFDARYITAEASGIGQMGLELLRGLAHLQDGFCLKVLVNDRTHLPADLWDSDNILLCQAPWDPRSLANQVFLPGLLRRLQVKVLHSIDCFQPLAAVGVSGVVNLHDVIPLICRKELARSRKGRWPFAWKSWLRLQCARASRVVTVSNHSAADIVRFLHLDPGKVHVIYNPVREWPTVEPVAELRRRLDLPGRVISTVGRQEPYKNLLTLVRAMRLVSDTLQDPSLRLVVAGSTSALYPEARQEVERLGLTNRIRFTGYLPEASLGALYQVSDLFVFPSLYEGFGLPPVEAMRFGVPVVAGRRAALPEVLGGAAFYVETQSPQHLAGGILEVLTDPALARRLRAAGLHRSARYSHGKAAAQYRRIYQDLLPKPA
jgi:glycosyltransferase involved in cell wall biosynthesis